MFAIYRIVFSYNMYVMPDFRNCLLINLLCVVNWYRNFYFLLDILDEHLKNGYLFHKVNTTWVWTVKCNKFTQMNYASVRWFMYKTDQTWFYIHCISNSLIFISDCLWTHSTAQSYSNNTWLWIEEDTIDVFIKRLKKIKNTIGKSTVKL